MRKNTIEIILYFNLAFGLNAFSLSLGILKFKHNLVK